MCDQEHIGDAVTLIDDQEHIDEEHIGETSCINNDAFDCMHQQPREVETLPCSYGGIDVILKAEMSGIEPVPQERESTTDGIASVDDWLLSDSDAHCTDRRPHHPNECESLPQLNEVATRGSISHVLSRQLSPAVHTARHQGFKQLSFESPRSTISLPAVITTPVAHTENLVDRIADILQSHSNDCSNDCDFDDGVPSLPHDAIASAGVKPSVHTALTFCSELSIQLQRLTARMDHAEHGIGICNASTMELANLLHNVAAEIPRREEQHRKEMERILSEHEVRLRDVNDLQYFDLSAAACEAARKATEGRETQREAALRASRREMDELAEASKLRLQTIDNSLDELRLLLLDGIEVSNPKDCRLELSENDVHQACWYAPGFPHLACGLDKCSMRAVDEELRAPCRPSNPCWSDSGSAPPWQEIQKRLQESSKLDSFATHDLDCLAAESRRRRHMWSMTKALSALPERWEDKEGFSRELTSEHRTPLRL